MTAKTPSAIYWLLCSVVVIALDQLSKHWAVMHLTQGPVTVLPFLNFYLAFNYGAAFSFLSNPGGWTGYLFLAVALAVSGVLSVWLWRTPASEKWKAFAISAIIGGAIGNVIDRLWHGFVIDFIDFHVAGWHFATFNVADAAISVGAAILIVVMLFEGREQKK